MSKWSDGFKDSRWQQIRLKVMERDHWTCQECGTSGKGEMFNVHHLIYESGKAPWEYENDLLITLCEKCHKKTHELQKLLLLRIAGYGTSYEGGISSIMESLIGYTDGCGGPAWHKGTEYEQGYASARIEVHLSDAQAICDSNGMGKRKEL